eukprot:358516-Chlamydomonas_euryale.AAC.5
MSEKRCTSSLLRKPCAGQGGWGKEEGEFGVGKRCVEGGALHPIIAAEAFRRVEMAEPVFLPCDQ